MVCFANRKKAYFSAAFFSVAKLHLKKPHEICSVGDPRRVVHSGRAPKPH